MLIKVFYPVPSCYATIHGGDDRLLDFLSYSDFCHSFSH